MASVTLPVPVTEFANGTALQNDIASKFVQLALSKEVHPPCPATRAAPIPAVDISGLRGDSRSAVIRELGIAAAEWGFVQLTNHGVSQPAVDGVWKACEKFFSLPADEKKPFVIQPSLSIRQCRETMRIRGVLGPEDLVPPNCREAIVEYSKQMRALAKQLFDAFLEFLGVPLNVESNAEFISTSGFSIHSYPPCLEGKPTAGLLGHTDFATMAFLLQDQVSGFELLKGDEWMSFKPLEHAFTLVTGEQLEILSNGKFKSVRHRVVVKEEQKRMSVACFFAPRGDTTVCAFPQVVDKQETSPYKDARRFGEHPVVAALGVTTNWFV